MAGGTQGRFVRRWGEARGPGGSAGVLDSITAEAAAAWSVSERLTDDFSGSLIRVRRASDNAEQDIGYVANTGLLNTTALATFCSGTNGFVKTLYDQTGNGYHHTQATAARQPKIYDSATGLVTLDALAAADLDGSATPNDDGYVVSETAGASCGLSGVTGVSFYWVGRIETHIASGALLGLGTWDDEETGSTAWIYQQDSDEMTFSVRTGFRAFACTYVGVTSAFIATIGQGATISTMRMRQNGVELEQTIGSGGGNTFELDSRGRHLGTSSFAERMDGKFVRAAVFGSALSDADIAVLEAGSPAAVAAEAAADFPGTQGRYVRRWGGAGSAPNHRRISAAGTRGSSGQRYGVPFPTDGLPLMGIVDDGSGELIVDDTDNDFVVSN